ncbi:hypothetical protein DFH09DRAFT_1105835 [Mycena vulgaris]|nr:hypothetical protein DFH09DRAFT_1105835 [Mycena vulgaris]
MQKADVLLRSARNPYIDNRAHVQRSPDEDDQYEDDEDSSKAQIRRADKEEFDMHGILVDHDARVLSAAPYRIPKRFLQSGAETPSRGEEWDFDMAPSRATSVIPPGIHLPTQSTPAKARSARTPLFLLDPDSRAPTPFVPCDSRDFTPYVSPREAREPIASTSSSVHARPSSISPPPAAKQLQTATPLRDEARAERIFRKISKFLDTVASDFNEDPEGAEDEDEEIRDSDLSRPPTIQPLLPGKRVSRVFRTQSAILPASLATVRHLGLRAETQSQIERRLKSLLPAQNEKTVVPSSWIRFQGHLVFVLGPKKLLMAKSRDIPSPPAPAPNKRQQTAKSAKKKQDAVPDVCWKNKLGREWYQKDYPQVSPSIDELAPFRTSRCDALQRRPFSGPSRALEAGDRVLIVGGERRGETAYVWQMQELRGPRGGSRLTAMVQHILSPSPPLHIFDRVRVNSGTLYCGAIGRLVSIDGPQVTVALPAETNFDEALPSKMKPDGTRHIDVPMEDINRHFLLGDVVLIVRGENKNRHGLVVHTHSDGSLEVFQTGYGLEVVEDVDVGPASTLNGPGRSIVKRHKTGRFDLHDYQDDSEFLHCARPTSISTCSTRISWPPIALLKCIRRLSVVEPPRVRPALPYLQKDQVKQAREYQRAADTDDRLAYDAKKAANEAVQNKMLQLEPPASFAELHQKVFERDRDKAAAFSSWEKKPETDYTGIYVQVAYQGNNKGFRGQVISTYHTPARYERLKSQKRRRFMEGDTRGIMVTIRNDSNRQVSEPIEKVVHDMTRLPLAQARYLPPRVLYAPRLMTPSSPEPRAVTPPWIPADASAEEEDILALEEAAHQQALQFEEHLPSWRTGWEVASNAGSGGEARGCSHPRPSRFQGETGYPQAFQYAGRLQRVVSGSQSLCTTVGPKRRPLGFPASSIKPARADTDGVDILMCIQRVVVLGPDVTEDTSLVVIRVNGSGRVFYDVPTLTLYNIFLHVIDKSSMYNI